MSIAIIDCGAGNLHSVRKAFAHMADVRAMDVAVTTSPEQVMAASHIVLPGVGTFADCMNGLLVHDGLKDALLAAIQKGTPLFGICVGMQMLFQRGHEFGVTEGLGLFAGEVRAMVPDDESLRIPHMGQLALQANETTPATLRIPHMGWNELKIHAKNHPIFKGLDDGVHVYFVHSYHGVGAVQHEVLASVDYGQDIVACIGRDNIVATQFHPEKSQRLGLTMIDNFLGM